jgi:ABC-type phosphate transport system substrate-binding protein
VKKTRLAQTIATLALTSAGLLALFPTIGTATAPATGVNCQANGKINGRGATFQKAAQDVFAAGFAADVCGSVTNTPADAAGSNMVIYNYPGIGTGSGQGQRATICRSDAFAGTDVPYDNATKALFDGPPGVLGGLGGNCTPAVTPPFTPNVAPFPNAADVAAPVMSFPVAGSSVVIGVNIQAANCTGARPTAIQLTGAMVSNLFQGEITNWNDPQLRVGPTGAINAALATCNLAVKRVVRSDKSGTTQIQKNYLKAVDPSSQPTCVATPDFTWSTLALDASNQTWPTGGTCTALVTANGNAGVVAACADSVANPGAVCYADLADISAAAGNPLLKSSIRNGTNTAFAAPNVSLKANCNFGAVTTPGTGTAGAVGLDPADTWAFDNALGNRSDVTNQGAAYPICGMTFELVFTGLNDGGVANANSQLTANQRRTLYSFMTYILSSTGQDRLTTNRYQSLGASLVSSLRTGFQAAF